MGAEEKRAVMAVMERGVLSQFLGEPDPDFFGGPEVLAVEKEFASAFGSRYAVSTNSATTALQTAVAACGLGPGDEVIVSPFTMSATASAILTQNAIPVFADIQPDTFCLDPESVRARISPRTRAIMVVDIFGQPAHWDELREIARAHKLRLIEDAAQASGADFQGTAAGTLGDIGVLSLNYHKIIHAGEGGILLCHEEDLARGCQLIRNHGEAVVEAMHTESIANGIGSNFRLTELQAAIARVQLRKLPGLFARRWDLGCYLTRGLDGLRGIQPPKIVPGATSTYYVYAVRLGLSELDVSRETFTRALGAEGIPFGCGYVQPLYLQPLYQRRIAYGASGCPWSCGHYTGTVSYEPGICPVAEAMHAQELILADFGAPPQERSDMDDVVRAFEKVIEHLPALRDWQRREEAESADRRPGSWRR
jgi:dTDP-4-amino-4,6-dideoxygalactose transaminase